MWKQRISFDWLTTTWYCIIRYTKPVFNKTTVDKFEKAYITMGTLQEISKECINNDRKLRDMAMKTKQDNNEFSVKFWKKILKYRVTRINCFLYHATPTVLFTK